MCHWFRKYGFEILFLACGLFPGAVCLITSGLWEDEEQAQASNSSYYQKALALQSAVPFGIMVLDHGIGERWE